MAEAAGIPALKGGEDVKKDHGFPFAAVAAVECVLWGRDAGVCRR